jgi:hypothetical protein
VTQIVCNTPDQLRLLGDRILLRPLDWKPSEVIDVVRHGRPLRGEVMAVGKGHHPLKYKPHHDGKHKIVEYRKRFQPTEVKVGDVVELGGLNVFDGNGYDFPEVVVGNEMMLIITERDVAGVQEKEPAHG